MEGSTLRCLTRTESVPYHCRVNSEYYWPALGPRVLGGSAYFPDGICNPRKEKTRKSMLIIPKVRAPFRQEDGLLRRGLQARVANMFTTTLEFCVIGTHGILKQCLWNKLVWHPAIANLTGSTLRT